MVTHIFLWGGRYFLKTLERGMFFLRCFLLSLLRQFTVNRSLRVRSELLYLLNKFSLLQLVFFLNICVNLHRDSSERSVGQKSFLLRRRRIFLRVRWNVIRRGMGGQRLDSRPSVFRVGGCLWGGGCIRDEHRPLLEPTL